MEKHRILGEIYDTLFHKIGKYKLKLHVNRMFKIIDNNFLLLQISVPVLEVRWKSVGYWVRYNDTLFHKIGKWKYKLKLRNKF